MNILPNTHVSIMHIQISKVFFLPCFCHQVIMCTLTLHTRHVLIDRRNKTVSSPWHHLGFFYSYFLPSCLKLDSAFFSPPHLPELLCLASGFFTTSPFKALPLSRIPGSAAVKLRRGFFSLAILILLQVHCNYNEI